MEMESSKEGAIHSAVVDDDYDTHLQHSKIEPKYHGTEADRRDMLAMGRIQELRVRCAYNHVACFGSVADGVLPPSRETSNLSPSLVSDVLCMHIQW